MKLSRWLLIAVFLLNVAPRLWCGEEAEGYYQKGMDSYLQGDDDQAILWAAKSLEVEPDFKKAQDLLSVLVVEKERGTQTEIWLGKKTAGLQAPVTVENADLTEVRRQVAELRTRLDSLEKRDRVGRLERRIQVVASMIQKSSTEQYLELRGKQDKAAEKIDGLFKGQKALGLSLFWLFVLVFTSLFFSLWALWRRREAAPRLTIEKD